MGERPLGTHFLKQWREHQGLSLRKLASAMVPSTSHANIGRIENMQQPYSQEIMEAAATVLKCSVVDLLTVDPTTSAESAPDRQLRSALLAYGIDGEDLPAVMRAISGFVSDADEPQPQDRFHDQSELASRRRAKAPSE
ncbi:helix-turn-helix domain-containing protein [Mesorhizobium sp. BE184]|uniref:helix-turn-helix domain-containing protein n=1 Tax=Mesorhizobium sp. BE184 TaxID=2817714 RepID=UPI003862124A